MEKHGKLLKLGKIKKVKTTNLTCILLLLICTYSCKEKFPDSYGIYSVSNNEINTIVPKTLLFKGNMFSSISGLKEVPGTSIPDIDNLIVFEKNINPQKIILSKLKFQKNATVSNLIGNSNVDVNLWTVYSNIEIKISPIDGKPDMYRIIPVSPLKNGFYAIHFEELSNKETLNAIDKVVYGFVIGSSIKPYQLSEKGKNQETSNQLDGKNKSSFEPDLDYSDIAVNQQEFYNNAKLLLNKANEYFNINNYVELRNIYLNHNESKVNNAEWVKLTTGFGNWAKLSGKIKSSTIKAWNYENTKGTFKIQTEYEKAGLVNEELVVIIKDNSYYITFIGTK